MAREIEPLWPALNLQVEGGEQPRETPLHPHGLVRIEDRPITPQAGDEPAVLVIDAVTHPERHDVIEQPVAINRDQVFELFVVHSASSVKPTAKQGVRRAMD